MTTGRRVLYVSNHGGDRLLDRLLMRRASGVIVNSKAVGRRFGWAPPGKVRCIHNGVDLARFAPRLHEAEYRRALGLPEVGPVVASIGRFVPYKGYAHLIEAAALVADPAAAARMAAAARELAAVSWSWTDSAKATIEPYRAVARG